MDPIREDPDIAEQPSSASGAGKVSSSPKNEDNPECEDHGPPAAWHHENSSIVRSVRAQPLPTFKIQGFVTIAAEGSRREAERVEEEQRRLKEERRAQRKKREDETAMWTTPCLRPLAEAPEMDWDWYKRKVEISKLRYQRLFPGDVGLQSAIEDIDAEFKTLGLYTKWAETMSQDPETPKNRKAFYRELNRDTMLDFKEVKAERDSILARATQLGKFEYLYLDNDLETTELERKLRSGGALLDAYGEETKKKYGHLVPPRINRKTRPIDSEAAHRAQPWTHPRTQPRGPSPVIDPKKEAAMMREIDEDLEEAIDLDPDRQFSIAKSMYSYASHDTFQHELYDRTAELKRDWREIDSMISVISGRKRTKPEEMM